MKRTILSGVFCAFLFASSAFGVPMTQIEYAATDLGLGKWQYTYEVINLSLPTDINEFTIWFDFALYDNLAVETLEPLKNEWDEMVVQPDPVLSDDGCYDALVLDGGIGIGESVSGFAVSFDWLGVGQPGSQFYEIIDPVTFETIDSGMTIPEPATVILLGLGTLMLRRKKCSHRLTRFKLDTD